MQDLTFLHIQHLIIHELPRRGQSDGILSDGESPLPQQVRQYFEGRIRSALGASGLPVGFVEGHASPVPALVEGLLAKSPTKRDFIAASQGIAQHLFTLQNAVQSEGLLCVASCDLKTATAVAIIKLELEDGVRAKLKGAHGRQHFEIEIVDDLMLTRNTRVFKVAIFAAEDPKTIEALACDNQRARGLLLAEYFVNRFLGCELLAKPDISTKRFLEATEGFINSQIADPIVRARYHTALLAELNSTNTSVRSRDFADSHMGPKDRRPFLASLKDASVPVAFAKDTSLVKSRLARSRYDFEGDISVSMPPDALERENVTMKDAGDGKTKFELESKLESVHGAR